jgi:hypothetical protein
MKFKISQFEAKCSDKDNWKMVSDVAALKMLQDNYGKVTPMLSEILRGKEIKIRQGVLRIKKTSQ